MRRAAVEAAKKENDGKLTKRGGWEFLGCKRKGETALVPQAPVRFNGTAVLNPVDEANGASSNHYSQWCLSAITNLELIGDYLPKE